MESLSYSKTAEQYREQGPVDISGLSESEIFDLKQRFLVEFDQYSENDQSEITEQLLLHGQINDRECLAIAGEMTGDQKTVLGEFIGKTLDAVEYTASFYYCWNYLDEQTQSSFIVQFTQDEPENIAAVAPFISVSDIGVFISSEYKRKGLPRKNETVESEFSNHEDVFGKLNNRFGLTYEERDQARKYYEHLKDFCLDCVVLARYGLSRNNVITDDEFELLGKQSDLVYRDEPIIDEKTKKPKKFHKFKRYHELLSENFERVVPVLSGLVEQDELTEQQIENVKPIIDRLLDKNGFVVLPYLADFYRLGIITKEEYQSYHVGGEKDISAKHVNPDFFQTDEEVQALESIQEKVRRIDHKKGDKFEHFLDGKYYYRPVKFSFEARGIESEVAQRCYQHSFSQYYKLEYQRSPEIQDSVKLLQDTVVNEFLSLSVVQESGDLSQDLWELVEHLNSLRFQEEKIDVASFFDAVLERLQYILQDLFEVLREQYSGEDANTVRNLQRRVRKGVHNLRTIGNLNNILDELGSFLSEKGERAVDLSIPDIDLPKDRSRKNKMIFLRNCIENNVAIFSFIDEFDVSAQEVRSLLSYCRDGKFAFLLEDLSDMKKLIEMGYEKDVLDFLSTSSGVMSRGYNFNYQVINEIRSLEILMSEGGFNRLLNLIKKAFPEFLFYDMEFAIEYELVDPMQILSRYQHNSVVLLRSYLPSIRYYQLQGKTEQEIEDFKKDYYDILLASFDSDPEILLRDYKKVLEIISLEDVHQKFNDILGETEDLDFFSSCLWHREELPEVIVSQVVEKLKKRNDLLIRMIDSHLEFDELLELFGQDLVMELILEYQGEVEIVVLLRENKFFLILINNEEYLQRFLENLEEHAHEVCQVWSRFSLFMGSYNLGRLKKDHNIEVSQEEIDIIEKTKKQVVEIYGRKCQEDYRFAFYSHSKEMHSREVKQVYDAHIKDYLLKNPELVSNDDVISFTDNWVYDELFREYPRVFAFVSDSDIYQRYKPQVRYGWSSSDNDELFAQFKTINVDIEYRHEHGTWRIKPDEYYSFCIEQLQRDNPFYYLHQKKFESHARNLESLGKEPDDEFHKVKKRLGLVKSSPITQNNFEALGMVTDEEAEQFCDLIELCAQFGIDGDLDIEIDAFLPKYALRDLQKSVIDQLGKIFNAEISEYYDLREFPIGIIEPLKIYAQRHQESIIMNEAITSFLEKVFSGKFHEHKYWGGELTEEYTENDAFDYLVKENYIPKNIEKDQYLKWVQDEHIELEALFEYDFSDIFLGIREIESQAFADNHIEQDDLETNMSVLLGEYSTLLLPSEDIKYQIKQLEEQVPELKLRGKKRKKANIPQEIDEEYQALRQEAKQLGLDNLEEINRLQALMCYSRLRNLSREELENGVINLENQRISFERIFGDEETKKTGLFEKAFKEQHPNFYNDLLRIKSLVYETRKQLFGTEQISKKKLYLTDEHNLEVYFRIGEKPVPSCQHYNSEHGPYDQGLLSYQTDPTIKIIQIHDENEQIIARSIIRLVEDDYGDPAIFVERIYSTNMHPNITRGILNLVHQKAQKMNVRVYSTEIVVGLDDESEVHNFSTIHSKKSMSPYTYSDAGGGLRNDGLFTITRSQELRKAA